MEANHLHRLAAASAPALYRRPQAPSAILRLALSNSTPVDQSASADGASPKNGEAAKEADTAEGAGARKEDANRDEEEGGSGSVHVNRTTSEISGPRGPKPTWYCDWERGGRCLDL